MNEQGDKSALAASTGSRSGPGARQYRGIWWLRGSLALTAFMALYDIIRKCDVQGVPRSFLWLGTLLERSAGLPILLCLLGFLVSNWRIMRSTRCRLFNLYIIRICLKAARADRASLALTVCLAIEVMLWLVLMVVRPG